MRKKAGRALSASVAAVCLLTSVDFSGMGSVLAAGQPSADVPWTTTRYELEDGRTFTFEVVSSQDKKPKKDGPEKDKKKSGKPEKEVFYFSYDYPTERTVSGGARILERPCLCRGKDRAV